jgi:hypothetical protein
VVLAVVRRGLMTDGGEGRGVTAALWVGKERRIGPGRGITE